MWLDNIALLLREATVPGLPRNSVFVQTIPADLSIGVMVASGYQGMKVDPELPGYHKGPMQLIVRAKTSLAAEEIALALSEILNFEGRDVGDILVNYIRPRHLPAVFPSSKGDHYEASVNFDICFVRQIG